MATIENKKFWSRKEIFKFIARYKHYRELWDTKSIEYRNKLKRRISQNKLAAEFNTTAAEVCRKIRILRSQFFFEYKKMYNQDEDGSSQSAYVTKWEYYQPLQFILVSREGSEECIDQDPEDSSIRNDENSNNSDYEDDSDTKIMIIPGKRKRSEGSSDSNSDHSMQSDYIPNDDFQTFGNYVANELRTMHYAKNVRKLKRLIQHHIVRWTAEDDREYFSKELSI